jgi:hypothetical protein
VNSAEQIDAHLRALAQQRDLEEVCTRCGDCCTFAFRMATPMGERRYLVPGLPCRFLETRSDGRTHCTVYDRRPEAAPWCGKDLAGQLTRGVASPRCGYTADQPWFLASEPIAEEMLRALAGSILEQLEATEHTLDPDALRRFRDRWSPAD